MKQNKNFGFTLIELIVVIFIIGLISTISIANFRASEKQKRVVLAVDTVIGALRDAQNLTLAGKKIGTCTPSRYYVDFIYAQSFGLYAVTDCGGTPPLIMTYTLPANTRFQANGFKINGTASDSIVDVAFYLPFASTMVSGNVTASETFNTVTVTVESTDGAISKTITVDGLAGRIE